MDGNEVSPGIEAKFRKGFQSYLFPKRKVNFKIGLIKAFLNALSEKFYRLIILLLKNGEKFCHLQKKRDIDYLQ